MRIGDSEVQLMEVARFKITFATILSRVVTLCEHTSRCVGR